MISNIYYAEISDRRLMVQWELASTMTSQYEYEVVLSYSENDREVQHASDAFYVLFEDFRVKKLTKDSKIIFSVIDKITKEPIRREIMINKYDPYYWMLRRTELYKFSQHMKLVSGKKILVMKKRNWGPRCTHCNVDTLGQSKGRDTCLQCLGTGFLAGFYDPIKLYGKITGEAAKLKTTYVGQGIAGMRVVQLYSLPRLERGDIVYNHEDDFFYTVVQTVNKETTEVPSLQSVTIVSLPKKAGSDFRPYLNDYIDIDLERTDA